MSRNPAISALVAALAAPPAGAATFQVIYTFQGGTDARASVADLLVADGQLYGTSLFGGHECNHDGCGTVFTLDPNTGIERVLHRFRANGNGNASGFEPENSLAYTGHALIGSARTNVGGGALGSVVFKMNINTGYERVQTTIGDSGGFAAPNYDKGNAYLTAYQGGSSACTSGCGTIVKVDPHTGAHSVIYQFAGGDDGANPLSPLLVDRKIMYGTTSAGGNAGGGGTIFKFDPATGTHTVLYSFDGAAGGNTPRGHLILDSGKLYGITEDGGNTGCNGGCGIAYKFDLTTSTLTILHLFVDRTGNNPLGGLTMDGGLLYGITYTGGAHHFGTAFTIDPVRGKYTDIHDFGDSIGNLPYSGLVAIGTTLYGTTSSGGGPNYSGTVYSITP
jgi:uncharacterized repeat protein (TIGR03803 family)